METIRELLAAKGNDVWCIAPDQKVYDALAMMAFRNVGALLVMDAGKMVGLVSERDYARKIILKGKASKDTPVADIMVRRVICIRPEQTIHECMALMTQERVRHTPVVENDQLRGLISIGDVVKAIISNQSFMIEQMQTYVMGCTAPHPTGQEFNIACAGGLNCWEFTHCGREPGGSNVEASGICPATVASALHGTYHGINGGRVCFGLTGTLCAGEIQGDFAAKAKECLQCRFYQCLEKEEHVNRQEAAAILARLDA